MGRSENWGGKGSGDQVIRDRGLKEVKGRGRKEVRMWKAESRGGREREKGEGRRNQNRNGRVTTISTWTGDRTVFPGFKRR